ncbi:MAG: FkbM family methyltransferase [Actinomycetota bacterium]|nr:FkbM family methyltransferase [Actinomycetota bacterium]
MTMPHYPAGTPLALRVKIWLLERGWLDLALALRRRMPVSFLWESAIALRLAMAGLVLRRRSYVNTRMGYRLNVLSDDPRARLLEIRKGVTDPEAMRLWNKLLDAVRPTVVLDVGANYGEFTIPAALYRTVGRVIALEPNPDVARCLRRTVMDVSKVQVVTAAAGAYQGAATLQLDDRGSGFGRISFEAVSGVRDTTVVVALDDLGLKYSQSVLLKVDVEGNELEVLEGARHLFRGTTAAALVEVHHLDATARQRLAQYITDLGLQAFTWELGRSRLIPLDTRAEVFLTGANPNRYLKDIVVATADVSQSLTKA